MPTKKNIIHPAFSHKKITGIQVPMTTLEMFWKTMKFHVNEVNAVTVYM